MVVNNSNLKNELINYKKIIIKEMSKNNISAKQACDKYKIYVKNIKSVIETYK